MSKPVSELLYSAEHYPQRRVSARVEYYMDEDVTERVMTPMVGTWFDVVCETVKNILKERLQS